jgi:hypothetical protein
MKKTKNKKKVMEEAAMKNKKEKKRKKRRKNLKIPSQLWLSVSSTHENCDDIVDARDKLCPTQKHHFDECAERVRKAQENPEEHKGHNEDCAEEFLHLMHCVDKNIAVPLFKQLN